MRVWLMEKDKTYVPAMVEAQDIRYSRRRNSLVIYGNFRWYEIVMSVDDAKEIMDECLSGNDDVLDLRKFKAIGFER